MRDLRMLAGTRAMGLLVIVTVVTIIENCSITATTQFN